VKVFKKHQISTFNSLIYTHYWSQKSRLLIPKPNTFTASEDYVGWHSDNEIELGKQPFIASLTLGAERLFEFRHKKSLQQEQLLLRSGTLLMMQPDFQHDWLHRVPPDKNVQNGRINLTFRNVVPVIKSSVTAAQ
jgi:alkylated DNA repair dioxygenase AlkB